MADLKVNLYPHQRMVTLYPERYVCYECGQRNSDSARSLCARSRRLRRNMFLIETRNLSLKRKDGRLKEIREKLRQDLKNIQTSPTAVNRGDFRVNIRTNSRLINVFDAGFNADIVCVEIKVGRDTTTESKPEENVEVNVEMSNRNTVTKPSESSLDRVITTIVSDETGTDSKDTTDSSSDNYPTSPVQTHSKSPPTLMISTASECYSKSKNDSFEKRTSLKDICPSVSVESNSKRPSPSVISPSNKHCNRYHKGPQSNSLTLKTVIKSTSTRTSTHHGRPRQSLNSAMFHNDSSFHRFSPRRLSVRRHRRSESRATTPQENSSSSQRKSPSKRQTKVMQLARAVLRVIPAKTWPRKPNSSCTDFVLENTLLKRCTN